jgi:hypothetical protein
MKALAFILAHSVVATARCAQGTVLFNNNVHYDPMLPVDTPFYDAQLVPLAGARYRAQLFYWHAAHGFIAVGSPVPFGERGYFDGNAVTLPLVVAGNPASVQVRAWETLGGSDFEHAALAGVWTGTSEVLYIAQTGGYSNIPTLPAYLVGLRYPGPPIFVRPPQPRSVRVGRTTVLSVVVSSAVQSGYQWYVAPFDQASYADPQGAHASFTTPPLFTNTVFWVVVTNVAGAVTSDPVTVTVLPRAPTLKLERLADLPVLTLEGPPAACRLEWSADLALGIWTTLLECTLRDDPVTFVDTAAGGHTARYYRAVVP